MIKLQLTNLKLKILSGISFILSGILGFFSIRRQVDISMMISRVAMPEPVKYVYHYVWELLSVAVLFFITAITFLIISFKKTKK